MLKSSESYYLHIQMTLKSSHSQTRFGKRTTWSGNCGFDDNGDDDADADDGFCNLNPKNISNLWSLITSMSVHQLSYHLIMTMMMMLMMMMVMMMRKGWWRWGRMMMMRKGWPSSLVNQEKGGGWLSRNCATTELKGWWWWWWWWWWWCWSCLWRWCLWW